MSYLTVLLSADHKKSDYNCGQKLLDIYLQHQAKQDVKRHLAACFVIITGNDEVKGYYTLSNASINRGLIPIEFRNKLPVSYNDLPVTLLGRLARDKKFSNERLGELLLLDALKRCNDTSKAIGSMAVVVHPIDDKAISFYSKYGFIHLPESGKMFMAMKTICEIFKQ
jgi:ribosomal protein S18 acetylase RimI-like enzyme